MRLVDDRLRLAASDVSNFVACRHLTRLDQAVAHRLVRAPMLRDAGAEALATRGDQHERQVLEGFRRNGWSIAELPDDANDTARTLAAMDSGVDVVYQGTLQAGNRFGRTDFLVRAALLSPAEERPRPGYEVIDAKLARSAKARAVLQTAFYSQLLGELTGAAPQYMHLALGGGELIALRVADYAAYTCQVLRMLGTFTDPAPQHPPVDTYPDQVEHCAVCRWRLVCRDKRRADDDLSLIAGITARQRRALTAAGITTRRGLAALAAPPPLDRVSAQAMAKTHAQARLQVAGEDAGELRWEFVDAERDEDGALSPNRGLTALPPPSDGDLFFDIEGARYYSEDAHEYGLQYLFGIVDIADTDDAGVPRYHGFWAYDRRGEKRAFEALVDFIVQRRQQHPDLHVYHYNHYEPTALDRLTELHDTREEVVGRLMGRFGTREAEVDDLLRRGVFVDLYRVVRQGIRASVESYSIKRLEPLFGYRRQVALGDVNERMVEFESALDEGVAQDDPAVAALIQGYNEDDCRATLGLRDWLEDRRSDLADQLGQQIPRPTVPEVQETEEDSEVDRLRRRLLDGVPEEDRTPAQQARALMADLLEWHRRDVKPDWWRYFHLRNLTEDELIGEPDAVAGLRMLGEVEQIKRSVVVRYSYPPQEHPFGPGEITRDPDSGVQWTIYALDEAAGTLDIKRGKSNPHQHPTALIEREPLKTPNHRARLLELGALVADQRDDDWALRPELDLLLGRAPRFVGATGGPLRVPGESAVDAGRRLVRALEDSYLAIQGPPGSGKTYTAAKQISDLIAAGRRVGVTAISHAVIGNLLNEVASQSEVDREVSLVRKTDDDLCDTAGREYDDWPAVRDGLATGAIDVVGATTWVWTSEQFRDSVDVLFVDEAGQMSLANVLAAAQAAPRLVLLGDPQQLGQPSGGTHPPGAEVSALGRVLGEAATMPEDRGLFIEQTRRMHPDICGFTSEVFYRDRLNALDGLERQAVLGEGPLSGAGLRVVDVAHTGNDNSSPEEADVVAELIARLRTQSWRDADGVTAPIGPADVLVVTPFNAQIREIDKALERRGITEARVGTVDKFQGQQAPVVIYSMASSSAEDAPRGMEFLYELNRLNVATSRARCLAILVSSPELVRVRCQTPRQIELANALCRFREMAQVAW